MEENNKLAGRYQIIEPLSKGAFGQTFLAADNHLPGNPVCVVKLLSPIINDPEIFQTAARLFNLEAETLYKLGNHDQIPSLYAHFKQKEEFYLVEEYIEGHTLKNELTRGKKLSESYVIKLLRDTLEVLGFVHQNKVIHRDIKPANLIRRKHDGKIILIDFGAVKNFSNAAVTIYGKPETISIGSAGYIPDEQQKGKPRFSSDIYALGIICLQALSGLFPLELPKNDQGEYCCAKLPDIKPVTSGLAEIIDKMVLANYKMRYQTANEALQALEQLLNGGNSSSTKIEPISGFLGWILLMGAIKNNVPLVPTLQQLINSLKYVNSSNKKVLEKASAFALVKAQQDIAQEYRREIGGLFPSINKISPFISQQKREEIAWVNDKIEQLKYQESLEKINSEMTDCFNSILTMGDSVNEIFSKRDKLIQSLLSGDEPLLYIDLLRKEKGGLLHLVCFYFAEKIKSTENLRELLSDLFFNTSLSVENFTNSLTQSQLDLQQLKQKLLQDLPTIAFSTQSNTTKKQ